MRQVNKVGHDIEATQETQVIQVPQARQVSRLGQDTQATQDKQVSKIPQARQVTEVGQDTQAIEDTQVRQVPRYTIRKTWYTISVHCRNHIWSTYHPD